MTVFSGTVSSGFGTVLSGTVFSETVLQFRIIFSGTVLSGHGEFYIVNKLKSKVDFSPFITLIVKFFVILTNRISRVFVFVFV